MTDPRCVTPDCPGEVSAGIHDCLVFDLLDDDGDPTGSETITGASIYAHICECGELIDIGIEDPREKDAGVAQMRAAIEKATKLLDYYVGHYQCTEPSVLRGITKALERSLK